MARIRSLKPMFFKNEILAELPPLTRLLFAGLWGMADRRGRLEYRPKLIKVEVLPYDDCNIETMLKELEDHNFLKVYFKNEKKIIWIINFEKHQRISGKEADSDSELPPYREAMGKQRGSNGEATGKQSRRQEGKGKEGKGKEGNSKPPNPLFGELVIPDDLKVNEVEIKAWIAYKREVRQGYTPRGLGALWDYLRRIPAHLRAASIERSMAAGYKGIFAVKGGEIGDTNDTGNCAAPIPGKYAHLDKRRSPESANGAE